MNASDRRQALFWEGSGNEVSLDTIEPTVWKLYGSGPFRGGKSRSEISNYLGLSLSEVNRIINKRHKRIK